MCDQEKTAWQGPGFSYILMKLCTLLVEKGLVLFSEKEVRVFLLLCMRVGLGVKFI